MVVKKTENELKDSSLFEISDLIAEYLGGELSPTQEARLDEWLNEDENNQKLFDSICSKATVNSKLKTYQKNDSYSAYLRFVAKRRALKARVVIRMFGAAAAVIGLLFVGWQLQQKPVDAVQMADVEIEETTKARAIAPDKPLLKKYTGEEFVIDSSGYIAENEIAFDEFGEQAQSKMQLETVFNEMIVPSKCDFYFIMNDGTKVWMNANSSVRYPVSFAQNERTIHVSGEVYLEVSKDSKRPFYVEMDGMRVAVLGTSFNVRSYADENTQSVTLVEGKVKATVQSRDYSLMPGKQLTSKSDLSGTAGVKITNVDVNDITAWTRGYYVFKKSKLSEVAATLKNWYDIDIVFNTLNSREIEFTGVINKNESLDFFVKRLTDVSSVRCIIKENKLFIY